MIGPNDKGVGVCGANPPKTNQTEHRDFADDGDDGKELSTMKARTALCGCTLYEMTDGTFQLCRWNYSKSVPCLRAVGDLLRQIGAQQ